MSEMDERLQEQLDALDGGTPLESILAELGEGSELGSLVSLADSLRAVPRPEPQAVRARERKRQVMAAAKEPPQPTGLQWGRIRWVFAAGLGGATVVALLLLVLSVTAFGIWLAGPRSAHYATLMDVTGVVEVAAADVGDGWRAVAAGDRVRTGERIRTHAASGATLLFFDGSRTYLVPNTNLVMTRLDGDWGDELQVELEQYSGRTTHSVVPLRGEESAFLVRTLSAAASVRGTYFSVAVDARERSHFAVRSGSVTVTSAETDVLLAAGQATVVEPGQEPETPAYRFSVQGPLTNVEQLGDGEIWTVAGVAISVTLETTVSGSPVVGVDSVLVEGRVVDGAWVADSIELAPDEEVESTFVGTLADMEGDAWQVGSATVTVNEETVIGEGLTVGDTVRVTFVVQEDGSWLALSIEAFDNCTGADPHPKGVELALRYDVAYDEIMEWFCQGFGFGEIDIAYGLAEDTGVPVDRIFALRQSGMGWGQIRKLLLELDPGLHFVPEELEQVDCELTYVFTGTLFNNGLSPDDYAENVVLDYEIVPGSEYTDAITVTLTPQGWDVIQALEQVTFTVDVALSEDWYLAPFGTELQIRVFVAEADTPYDLDSELTVTIVNECGLVFEPEELEQTGCGTSFDFSGTLVNYGLPPDGEAANVELGFEVVTGGEFTETITITPTSWITIAAGGQVAFNVEVVLNESWNEVEDGTQVQISVFATADNLPEDSDPRLTLTITAECLPTPTPEFANCTGADPHPKGMELANRYGVPYQEIMYWFCTYHFGFGEIDMAYGMQLQTGTPVANIFNMKLGGMGWGNIKKEVLGSAHGKPASLPGKGNENK